ncbi:MAG: DUF4870 domain-containing protein [Planctomycetes bacterium]|nr:DUF4870 domain-containing protein [Planctomycetota bacterium]
MGSEQAPENLGENAPSMSASAAAAQPAGAGASAPEGVFSANSGRCEPGAPPGSGWATACHLVGLLDFGVSFLFVGVLATLVVWLARRDADAECDFHGKEALNLQLNLLAWQLLALPLLCCCLVGLPILVALPFVKLVALLVGAARAASGERWSYPLIVRVVR